jgi:hypothetical protein
MLRYPGGTVLEPSSSGYSLSHNFLSDLGMSRSLRARSFARAASIVALCSCLLFVGVAFTPENRLMALHVDFTRFAFRVSPLATLLLTIAVVRLPQRPSRVVAVLALPSVALLAYVGILDLGPDVLTSSGLVVQVIAQKCIAAIALLSFLLTSRSLPVETGLVREQVK